MACWYFSHSVGYLFTDHFLCCAKASNVDKIPFVHYCFDTCTLGLLSNKSSLHRCLGMFLLHFLLITSWFQVLHLCLWSILGWCFYVIWSRAMISFFCVCIQLEVIMLTPLYALEHFCKMSFGCMYVNSWVLCPADICIMLYASTMLFQLLSFIVDFKVRYCDASSFFFLLSITLTIESLVILYAFWDFFPLIF